MNKNIDITQLNKNIDKVFDKASKGFNYTLKSIKNIDSKDVINKSKTKTLGLINFIKEIRTNIINEENIILKKDPAIKERKEIFLYPSFRAMIYYRFAHRLYNNKHYFVARLISQIASHRTGIEIHPGAQIGKGLFIDHGLGVIIGETTVIGNNVTIYQGVTLGGTGKDKGKRHPNIEDDVMIGAGARILGPLTIGQGTKIGAGSVVLQSVPPYSTVVGVPGRVVKSADDLNPTDTLDQIHLPDPVLQDIELLRQDVEFLKTQNKDIIDKSKHMFDRKKRLFRK